MTILFVTNERLEVPSVTTAQMHEVNRITEEEIGPALPQILENAGRNLTEQAIECVGDDWKQVSIIVLAGNNTNGAGGVCAARHLANRGANVMLCFSAPEDELEDLVRRQRKCFSHTSGFEYGSDKLIKSKGRGIKLIVDALLDYNVQGAPTGTAMELIQWANKMEAPVLSLDTPSGLDSTTGESAGECIHSTWTMTLALPKAGLSSAKAGQVILADVGIPAGCYSMPTLGLQYVTPFDKCARIPLHVARVQ